jgi:hypothetical protein
MFQFEINYFIEDLQEESNCVTSIDVRDGEECIDDNALLVSRGATCDANVYGRIYLGDHGSQGKINISQLSIILI